MKALTFHTIHEFTVLTVVSTPTIGTFACVGTSTCSTILTVHCTDSCREREPTLTNAETKHYMGVTKSYVFDNDLHSNPKYTDMC